MDEHFVKENQKLALGPSDGTGQDMISHLPDPLLCHILSCLPTKYAVRTSILSSRWRNLWLWVPVLDLEFYELQDYGLEVDEFRYFNALASFVDKFLDLHSDYIHKLRAMVYGKCDASRFDSWINTVVKRKIQHLELMMALEWPVMPSFMMPLSVCTCETLVCLKLHHMTLGYPHVVSLPCLKIMHLGHVEYANDLAFETLISHCSVLEDLTIERSVPDNVKVLSVRSPTLRSFNLDSDLNYYGEVLEVVIDAPRLKYMRILDLRTDIFKINSLDSSATVDLTVAFNEWYGDILVSNVSPKKNVIRNFLFAISCARSMIIWEETLQVLYGFFRTEPLPLFRNLTYLSVSYFSLQMLPALLQSCPNLKSFALKEGRRVTLKEERLRFLSVPQCFLSSLELVDIEKPISSKADMKLVSYFLENAAVLKKLTLRVGETHRIEEEILTFPRRSKACQVVLGSPV